MTNVIIRIDTGQIVEIEEFHSVVGFSVDKIDQDMNRIIEMNLEEVILEVM